MLAADTSIAIGADPRLLVTSLLNDLDELSQLLERAASARAWLDAFLIAAGLNQIAEDRLHDGPYPLDDTASVLCRSRAAPARLAGRFAAAGSHAAVAAGAARRSTRDLRRWQLEAAHLCDELADAALGYRDDGDALATRCLELARAARALPEAVRQAVVRLPACFHEFDQRPDDLELLAERFIAARTDRPRPVLVAGVRTSGSYLAPLIAAMLRARGAPVAGVLTMRPGRALLRAEQSRLRSLARSGGQALLIDDPPVSGASLVAAATRLERHGVPHDGIVLLLALERSGGMLPATLSGYAAVLLAEHEWSVHARLEDSAARDVLAGLLRDQLELVSIRRVELGDAAFRRGHRRALYRVSGTEPSGRGQRELDILATSVGVGYFGARELAVARELGPFGPRVFGLHDGVLYREWIPGGHRLSAGADRLPDAAAAYVAARRRALPLARDKTVALHGQRPAWEVAGIILGRSFGRAAPLARVALVDRAARSLLRTSSPSVIDGSMSPGHWFASQDGSGAIKVTLTQRTDWSLGLACADPAFDLAGVGAGSDDPDLVERVLAAWRAQTGEGVERERLLLYELAHLWGRLREDPEREQEVRHASARAVARYFGGVFLADLDRCAGERAPLCALDIDGVLETEHLGFAAPTRTSAAALRALIAHGFRPVLATGRSVGEVADRCRAYGLEAGVAEYGAALCLDGGARVIGLVDEPGVGALARLRSELRAREGVRLDRAFRYAVRAYRIGDGGRRRPLEDTETADCLRSCGADGGVRAIVGDSQTDFVDAAVDKGSGLRALTAALGIVEDRPIAVAVGDTSADAPMLALAHAAFVPGHAHALAARTGARRVRRPYQAGLAEAVGQVLGHPPGGCPSCRLPRPLGDRALLLDLLSVAGDGRARLAIRAARLARRVP